MGVGTYKAEDHVQDTLDSLRAAIRSLEKVREGEVEADGDTVSPAEWIEELEGIVSSIEAWVA